jgi:hypothetical protein
MTHVFASYRPAVLVAMILLRAAALLVFAMSGATEPLHSPATGCPPSC